MLTDIEFNDTQGTGEEPINDAAEMPYLRMTRSIRPVHIYRLVDPRDRRPRYVGKTENRLHRRLSGHLKHAREGVGPCAAWIMELRTCGAVPAVELIETVPIGPDWPEREKFWIAEYRSQYPDLLNISQGGKGGGAAYMTPEVRGRIAASQRRLWADPAYRKKISGAIRLRWDDPDRLAVQAERWRALRADPEIAARMFSAQLREQRKPEYRARRSEAVKRRWQNLPREEREAVAERTRQQFSDPAARAAHGRLSVQIQSKVASKKLGIPLSDYLDLLASGQKFCTACGIVHPFSAFGPHPRGVKGLEARCRESRNSKLRALWEKFGRPTLGRRGPYNRTVSA